MTTVEKILQLATERHWSTYRLAKQACTSQSTLSNLILRGNDPSLFTLSKICDAFGISLSQFFDFDDNISSLTEEQRNLVKTWRQLSESQKDKVMIFILGMIS